ncbi:hypothetical protein DTL42_16945 [Bremerella cremea]|uniref:Uncharacterized protein n=1 Tax=Bremerella cremea TaxID=1031537 RepID=A0A368KMZ0_9BACT|nr:hypothetical protein [Bremerella cremea]RCS44613.1 hypothetical protein DTL42_16945 [Bremerella cremea]
MPTPEPENPFQSPETVSQDADVKSQEALRVATLKAAIRWFLICGISAAPSWIIAAEATWPSQAGMATGVLIFMVGYTLVDVSTRNHPLRQRSDVKITLAVTYGTRIAISLLFPVGFFVDIMCGVFAVSVTGFLFHANFDIDAPIVGFFQTLVTTLIQGCLLNGVLAVYGLLIYGIFRFAVGSGLEGTKYRRRGYGK